MHPQLDESSPRTGGWSYPRFKSHRDVDDFALIASLDDLRSRFWGTWRAHAEIIRGRDWTWIAWCGVASRPRANQFQCKASWCHSWRCVRLSWVYDPSLGSNIDTSMCRKASASGPSTSSYSSYGMGSWIWPGPRLPLSICTASLLHRQQS